MLNTLRTSYRLGLVTDAQSCYVIPEVRAVGLDGYFEPVIISSHYGYRKPDSRLFTKALDKMGLTPAEVVCIGNDMFRDIHGAALLESKPFSSTPIKAPNLSRTWHRITASAS